MLAETLRLTSSLTATISISHFLRTINFHTRGKNRLFVVVFVTFVKVATRVKVKFVTKVTFLISTNYEETKFEIRHKIRRKANRKKSEAKISFLKKRIKRWSGRF